MPQLDRKNKTPLFQQLMEIIITDIQNGNLAPGDKIMPERKLANYYQVNRSTVNHALDELTSLGWLTRRQGSGTEVAKGRLGSRQAPQSQWRRLLQAGPVKQDPYLASTNELREQSTPEMLDFASGDLPNELIPDFQFPAFTWEEIRSKEKQQTISGDPDLKEIICKRLAKTFNLTDSNQDLLITSGATQGISLILQTLLQPGDTIATEEPSFLFALPLFHSLGIHLQGIACDQDGLLPSELEQAILTKRIKLLYLNPSFQNPTGRTMSLNRRQAILAICQKYFIPVIEDDVYGELALKNNPPKLKQLAPEQVIYLGSLSKIFSASIKIGWLLAPKNLIKSLANTKIQLEAETNLFPQLLANVALRAPNYQNNHNHLIQELSNRSELFQKTLFPLKSDWHFQPIQGGLYYWLTWQHQNLTRHDWQLFLKEKLLIAPAFLFSNDTMAMRVNYTQITSENQKLFFSKLVTITQQLKEKG